MNGKVSGTCSILSNGEFPQYTGIYGEGIVLTFRRFNENYKIYVHDDGHLSIVTPYTTRTGI